MRAPQGQKPWAGPDTNTRSNSWVMLTDPHHAPQTKKVAVRNVVPRPQGEGLSHCLPRATNSTTERSPLGSTRVPAQKWLWALNPVDRKAGRAWPRQAWASLRVPVYNPTWFSRAQSYTRRAGTSSYAAQVQNSDSFLQSSKKTEK